MRVVSDCPAVPGQGSRLSCTRDSGVPTMAVGKPYVIDSYIKTVIVGSVAPDLQRQGMPTLDLLP